MCNATISDYYSKGCLYAVMMRLRRDGQETKVSILSEQRTAVRAQHEDEVGWSVCVCVGAGGGMMKKTRIAQRHER